MAAALSVAELRGLAKLHRAGVDGADEQLAEIIHERGDELPVLLGFPAANLRRLREHPDPVDVLVTTIEAVPGVVREARGRAQRESARRLALGVAQSAVVVDAGVELDPALVHACCTTWPGAGRLMFGERGAIDIRRLRALLKECRGLPISMLLTPTSLDIKWVTPRSRGHFKLTLWPGVEGADDLVVPLIAVPVMAEYPGAVAAVPANGLPEAPMRGAVTSAGTSGTEDARCAAQNAPGATEAGATAPETPSRVVEPPRRLPADRPRSRGMAVRFIDAIAAAMGAP